MPAVAVTCGSAPGGARMGAAPDPGMRLLQWERLGPDVGVAVELAGEGCRRLAPELLEYRDPFVCDGAAALEVGAEQGLDLLLERANADTVGHAPGGQHVERGHHLRRQNGIAIG